MGVVITAAYFSYWIASKKITVRASGEAQVVEYLPSKRET
jgi:hypothetical protein